ncbi:hypothetical protein CEXT_20811 [Caerostris extrusa]|uniref:Uncharacterized protein n=1 Tax=Caerostris extrusa TaxID=172846 RepID=A0AAV4SWT9_CAEEX|nr:hypothetical protein CEXT_20811 [Caerostris extrusa]
MHPLNESSIISNTFSSKKIITLNISRRNFYFSHHNLIISSTQNRQPKKEKRGAKIAKSNFNVLRIRWMSDRMGGWPGARNEME